MATDLRTLKPSQTRKIASQLEAGEGMVEFLSAVRTFLFRSSDMGHSADVVVATARELSAAGVWMHIDAKGLSEAIGDVKPAVRLRFLAGLPVDQRVAVERHWSRVRLRLKADCVRLSLPAGSANPKLAAARKLQQLNIDAEQFCEAYNHKTTLVKKGTPTSVVVSRDGEGITFTIHAAKPNSGRTKMAASEQKTFSTRGRLVVPHITDVKADKDRQTTK